MGLFRQTMKQCFGGTAINGFGRKPGSRFRVGGAAGCDQSRRGIKDHNIACRATLAGEDTANDRRTGGRPIH